MKMLLIPLLIGFFAATGALASEAVPLQNAVGKKLMVLQNITIPAFKNGVHFQDGRQDGANGFELNYETGGPVCFIGIASGEAWMTKKSSTVVASGTIFSLTSVYPITSQIQEGPVVTIGAAFQTDSSEVIMLSAVPVANWIAATYKVAANPSLLDAKILEQCFGAVVAVTK